MYIRRALQAHCIATEWDAQTTALGIQPATMPLTTLAATAIDTILPHPAFARATCMSYLPTDSAQFYTTPEDRLLLRKQQKLFRPSQLWLERLLGVRLAVSAGDHSRRLSHPAETVQKIQRYQASPLQCTPRYCMCANNVVDRVVDGLDHFTLACLQSATMESKSLVVALALLGRGLALDDAVAASRAEEEFQIDIWGVVEGGHDMDRLNNAVALSGAQALAHMLLSEDRHARMLRSWAGKEVQ